MGSQSSFMKQSTIIFSFSEIPIINPQNCQLFNDTCYTTTLHMSMIHVTLLHMSVIQVTLLHMSVIQVTLLHMSMILLHY